MVDVLVTGFGPFPGVERNPSGELLPALAGPGVRTLLLPVEYRGAADVLADALPRLRPDVVLLFGVASSDSVVRVEGVARNHGSVDAPDVSGFVQGSRPLRAGAPASYAATLPVAPLVSAVAASGRPVRVVGRRWVCLQCDVLRRTARRRDRRAGGTVRVRARSGPGRLGLDRS